MAELIPTEPQHNSEGVAEEKPVSSAKPKSPPSLIAEVVDTVKWLWEILYSVLESLFAFGKWCAQNPLGALALGGIAATGVYFFAFVHPFAYGTLSTARWAWEAWNPEGEQAYGRMVALITAALFFYHREKLKQAPPGGSTLGLVALGTGILLFVLAVRCLNPRIALAATPFLIYGAVGFVWGSAAARIILFPCAFLVFMIPVAALEQATSNLQFIITGAVGALSHLAGIAILAVGTTLTATDGSFNFEIAEGCSGIRSLTAMTMLTAVYVHLTQDRLWKKVIVFSCAPFFAIVGNIARIFSIVLVAKYYDPVKAAGIYHDESGPISIVLAIPAMLLFSNLVNLDFRKLAARFRKNPA